MLIFGWNFFLLNKSRFRNIFQCYSEERPYYLCFEFVKYFNLLMLSEYSGMCNRSVL